MTPQDAQAVFAAGWGEAELHDAVLTICVFNFKTGCSGTG